MVTATPERTFMNHSVSGWEAWEVFAATHLDGRLRARLSSAVRGGGRRRRRTGSAGIGTGQGVAAPESGSHLTSAGSQALTGPLAPAPSSPSGPSPEAQVAGRIQWGGCCLLGWGENSRLRAQAVGPGRPGSPQLPGGAGDPRLLPAPNSRLLPATPRLAPARPSWLQRPRTHSLRGRLQGYPQVGGWDRLPPLASGVAFLSLRGPSAALQGDRVPNPKAE